MERLAGPLSGIKAMPLMASSWSFVRSIIFMSHAPIGGLVLVGDALGRGDELCGMAVELVDDTLDSEGSSPRAEKAPVPTACRVATSPLPLSGRLIRFDLLLLLVIRFRAERSGSMPVRKGVLFSSSVRVEAAGSSKIVEG